MKIFDIGNNIGDSTTEYSGETPKTSSDFISRYMCDNNIIKVGIIQEVFMGGYVCQVSFGNGTCYGIWLNDILSGMSGTNNITMPEAGSRVLVMKSGGMPGFILGTIPLANQEELGVPFDVEDGGKDFFSEEQHNILKNQEGSPRYMESFNHGRPMDVFPGEWGVINELGNLIVLLKGMVNLKASDLSQIQLHFIDDLVRVVSKTYEHISSIGEDNIFDDHGKVSREIRYCTKSHETFGEEGFTDIAEAGDRKKFEPIEEKEIIDKIRLHLGYIGNLIRLFCLDDNGNALSEVHMKGNGDINVNSSKSITLHKRSISTPNRVKKYHETVEVEDVRQDEFEFNDDGTKEPQDAEKVLWERQSYNDQNYSQGIWEFADSEHVNESYISQREDGSIILKDAAGSMIELDGKGKIIITCANDIEFRSGEEIMAFAGKNINLRAKDSAELCCTDGDVKIKAEESMQIYSKNDGILMETDSSITPSGGIKLATNMSAPITLDASQCLNLHSNTNVIMHALDTCRIESLGKINLATLSLSCFGVVPAPPDFISVPGTPLLDINLYGLNTSLLSNALNVQSLTNINIGAKEIVISGEDATTIFGGGANGTNVNHVHSIGLGEYNYIPDGPDGFMITDSIIKAGAHIPTVVTPAVNLPNETLTTPFIKSVIDTVKFSFNANVYDGDIYEYLWQQSGGVWDMVTKDTVNGTSAFPGTGYSNYGIYSGGTTNKAGQFVKTAMAQYKT